jgi:hypothetical protein
VVNGGEIAGRVPLRQFMKGPLALQRLAVSRN